MLFETVEMIVDEPADLRVGYRTRPEIRWRPTGDARHTIERRDAERLILFDEESDLRRSVHAVRDRDLEFGVRVLVDLGEP